MEKKQFEKAYKMVNLLVGGAFEKQPSETLTTAKLLFIGNRLVINDKIEVTNNGYSINRIAVPQGFVQLLLGDKQHEAWRLFFKIKKTPLHFTAREMIFNIAVNKGLAAAERIMTLVKLHAPNGQTRFYAEAKYGLCNLSRHALIDESAFTLTDGIKAVTFKTSFGLPDLNLPLNVYASSQLCPLLIDGARWNIIRDQTSEFLAFAADVMATFEHAMNETVQAVIDKFFTDRQQSKKILEKANDKKAMRGEENDLYRRILNNEIIETKTGFFLWRWPYVFYVARTGEAYVFDHKSEAKRHAIMRAVKNGKMSTKMRQCTANFPGEQIIRDVCKKLAEKAPELAPIILP